MPKKRTPRPRNLINVNRDVQIANRNQNPLSLKEKYPPWLVRRIFAGKRYWEPVFWGLIALPPRFETHSELFSFFAKRLINYQLKHKRAHDVKQAIEIVEKEIDEIKKRMVAVGNQVMEHTQANYAKFGYSSHRIGNMGLALTRRLQYLGKTIRNMKQ